ncbi:CDP-glycerol glycerophosphotransferase family protein [Peribacillus frigoritolerans]|uniref:CDP-glycerol glycerophosphotransferase family protein n=1 Tax=Peribacillus frigoritolerans TaxID=450367 RepID=UPI002E224D77|nr:CDP-glycerol glycerophosphotransferase family protein [Peribacillus frigoritolerans]MED3833347.1 CDP-glycerol glycerophosphotransferase family protein [Peribacillus frigoritolerans]MED3849559.1 CDP-glycerol glycerophosphotransferase family protein [Peribacillus frigoritolerans]
MYGEVEVNDYHLLKYSLLNDFFLYFSSLNIYGLPIAQCLTEQFLSHIQPFIDQTRLNQNVIRKFRKHQKFQTMGDINEKLISLDKISLVTIQKNKKSILLSDEYYDFAVDQLKEYKVTMYGVIRNVHHNNLPNQFESFIYRDELLKTNARLVNQQQMVLKSQVEQKFKVSPTHYFFSNTKFQQWFTTACMNSVKWIYLLDQLILKTRPIVIITPVEAGIYGRVLSLLSKKYNIPFINMPLLLVGDRSIIPSRADHYFVWGRNQKNWLLSRKITHNKITETGNVKYYYEMKNSTVSKDSFYKKLNIPNDHCIIAFTTQPFPNTNNKLEKWIEVIPNNLPVTILVKKHRNDKYEYPFLTKKENVKIIANNYPLYDFLSQIDCLITISSNTAIEAILFDKPLLILQPTIPYHYHLNHNQINAHLANAQAGETIKTATELLRAVRKVIADPNYIDGLKKKGNQFLSETLITVDQAPMLAKKKIEEIILKHS